MGPKIRAAWTAPDEAAFARGLLKYEQSKQRFRQIRKHFLPHNTEQELVSYYYNVFEMRAAPLAELWHDEGRWPGPEAFEAAAQQIQFPQKVLQQFRSQLAGQTGAVSTVVAAQNTVQTTTLKNTFTSMASAVVSQPTLSMPAVVPNASNAALNAVQMNPALKQQVMAAAGTAAAGVNSLQGSTAGQRNSGPAAAGPGQHAAVNQVHTASQAAGTPAVLATGQVALAKAQQPTAPAAAPQVASAVNLVTFANGVTAGTHPGQPAMLQLTVPANPTAPATVQHAVGCSSADKAAPAPTLPQTQVRSAAGQHTKVVQPTTVQGSTATPGQQLGNTPPVGTAASSSGKDTRPQGTPPRSLQLAASSIRAAASQPTAPPISHLRAHAAQLPSTHQTALGSTAPPATGIGSQAQSAPQLGVSTSGLESAQRNHVAMGPAPQQAGPRDSMPGPGVVVQALQAYAVDPLQLHKCGDQATDMMLSHMAAARNVLIDRRIRPSVDGEANRLLGQQQQTKQQQQQETQQQQQQVLQLQEQQQVQAQLQQQQQQQYMHQSIRQLFRGPSRWLQLQPQLPQQPQQPHPEQHANSSSLDSDDSAVLLEGHHGSPAVASQRDQSALPASTTPLPNSPTRLSGNVTAVIDLTTDDAEGADKDAS